MDQKKLNCNEVNQFKSNTHNHAQNGNSSHEISYQQPITYDEEQLINGNVNISNKGRNVSNTNTVTYQSINSSINYKLYKRRFVMIVSFALIQLITSSLVSTCSPVSTQLQHAYDMENSIQINLVAQVYLLMHPLMTFPASILIDRLGMHFGLIIGSIFIIVGVWIRTLINYKFYFVIIGQLLAGIGRPFISNSTSKVASSWFPSDQRTTVTAIFSLIMTGSIVLGILYPGIIFNGYSPKQNDYDRSQGRKLGEKLMFNEAFIASILVLPAIFFYRNSPPSPPSKSANVIRQTTKEGLVSMKQNINYKLLLLVCGLQLGTFNAAGALVNYLISPYGFEGVNISIIGATPIVSGLLSVIFINPIIKRYHCYKLLINICLLGSVGIYAFIHYLFQQNNMLYAIIGQLVAGIFMISATPIILEFAVEITFPAGEQLSVGLLFAFAQLSGAFISFFLGFICKGTQTESLITFLIMAGLFFIGFLINSFIKEDLKRLKFEAETIKKSIKLSQHQKLSENLLKLSLNNNEITEPADQVLLNKSNNQDELLEKEVQSYIRLGKLSYKQNLSQRLSLI